MTPPINATPTLFEALPGSATRTIAARVRTDGASDAQRPRFDEALARRASGGSGGEAALREVTVDKDAQEAGQPGAEAGLAEDQPTTPKEDAVVETAPEEGTPQGDDGREGVPEVPLTTDALSVALVDGANEGVRELPNAAVPASEAPGRPRAGERAMTTPVGGASPVGVLAGDEPVIAEPTRPSTAPASPAADAALRTHEAVEADAGRVPEIAVDRDAEPASQAERAVRPDASGGVDDATRDTQGVAARAPAVDVRPQAPTRQESAEPARDAQADRPVVRAASDTQGQPGSDPGGSGTDEEPSRQQQQSSSATVPDATRGQALEARDAAARAADAVRPTEAAPAPTAQAVPTAMPAPAPATIAGASRVAAAPTLGVETNAPPPVEAQVSRGVNAVLAQKGGSVTLKLAPSSLGTLKVRMTMDAGRVSLDLEATTQKAHAALTRELPALRTSLESRGLQVERAQVHLAPTPAPAPTNADASQQRSESGARDGQAEQQREQRGQEQSRQNDGRGRDGRAFERFAHEAMSDGFTLGLNERA